MNNLQDIIKSIQKQNQTMRKVAGLSTLTSFAESLQKMNRINYDLTGLNKITEVARSMSHQLDSIKIPSSLSNHFATRMEDLKLPKFNYALAGLTSPLSQIAKQNQLLSDKLAGLATSQLLVSNNLADMIKAVSKSHLNQFNTLNIAMQGISNGFLRDISVAKTWDDFEIAEEANETISKIAEEVISNSDSISQVGLEHFRSSLLGELTGILSKSKTERARQFIIELITIISFLLTLYSVPQLSSDKTNSEVISETRKELNKLNTEFSQKITEELQKLNKTRIAVANVNLRYSTKKNCRIIGIVKKDQLVTVIEFRHKFLLISYLDYKTGEPKSGFVVKKYFKIEK